MPRSFALEILSAIASASRARPQAHPDAEDVESEFEVGEFDRIELSGPFDVEIETGKPEVRAIGPDWALDTLSVEVEGGCLSIGCDGECDGDVHVTIAVPKLHSLRMLGSGDVSVDNVKGDLFECASSGSGDLSIDEIKAERVKLSAAGSGDVRIDKVRGAELEARLMGSGDLSIDAIETTEFSLTINGSADANGASGNLCAP